MGCCAARCPTPPGVFSRLHKAPPHLPVAPLPVPCHLPTAAQKELTAPSDSQAGAREAPGVRGQAGSPVEGLTGLRSEGALGDFPVSPRRRPAPTPAWLPRLCGRVPGPARRFGAPTACSWVPDE